jgi:tetraacyldisaccharide-1-P 4'-kinase
MHSKTTRDEVSALREKGHVMTKKDHVKLAAVLADSRKQMATLTDSPWVIGTWKQIRHTLVETLAADNPRFDRERFIQATEA